MSATTRSTSPSLRPADRLAIVGRTGSGKTYLTRWFMLRTAYPWVVMDTKHDREFDAWRPLAGLQPMRNLERAWQGRQHVVIRPHPHELQPVVLDSYLGELHDAFEGFGTSIDEMYQIKIGTTPGPGIAGLVTRGRVRRQTVIMGSQRPAWVPQFMFTEATYIAIMALSTLPDRKRMFDIVGGHGDVFYRLHPRYWQWYDVGSDRIELFRPVTITK